MHFKEVVALLPLLQVAVLALPETSITTSTWICTPVSTSANAVTNTMDSNSQVSTTSAGSSASTTQRLKTLTISTFVTLDVSKTALPSLVGRSQLEDACPSGYAPVVSSVSISESATFTQFPFASSVSTSGSFAMTSSVAASVATSRVGTSKPALSLQSSPLSSLWSSSATGSDIRASSSDSSGFLGAQSSASSASAATSTRPFLASSARLTKSSLTGSVRSSSSLGSSVLSAGSSSASSAQSQTTSLSIPSFTADLASTSSRLGGEQSVLSSFATTVESTTNWLLLSTTTVRSSTFSQDVSNTFSGFGTTDGVFTQSKDSTFVPSETPSHQLGSTMQSRSSVINGPVFGNFSASLSIGTPPTNATSLTGLITGAPANSSFAGPPSTMANTTTTLLIPTSGPSNTPGSAESLTTAARTTSSATSSMQGEPSSTSSGTFQTTSYTTSSTVTSSIINATTNSSAVLWPTPSPTDFDFANRTQDLDNDFTHLWPWIELWKRDPDSHKDEIDIHFHDIYDLIGKFKPKLPSPPDIPVPDCMNPPDPKCGPFPLNYLCKVAGAVIHLIQCIETNLDKLKSKVVEGDEEGVDDNVLRIKKFMEAMKSWDPKTQPPYLEDPNRPTPSKQSCSPQTTVTETSVSCLVAPVSTNARMTTQSCTTTTSTKVGCDIVGFATTTTSTATCSPSLVHRTSVSCVAAPDKTNPATMTQSCATVTSTFTGCEVTGTATTTVSTLPASKTACRRECIKCRGPTPTSVPVPPRKTGVVQRTIGKRALFKPSDFQNNIDTFMTGMCWRPGGNRIRHAEPEDGYSTTGATWRLANTMNTFCVANLWGCTAVVVISRKRVWLAQIYENPSMLNSYGTEVFANEVRIPIERGGGGSDIPVGAGVGSFAGPGGEFDTSVPENNVRVFVVAPVVHYMAHYSDDVAHALEHDELKNVLAAQLRINVGTINVVKYRPLELDAEINTWDELELAWGKVLVAYDPSEPVAPNAGWGACPRRPALDLWIENRMTPYYSDAWSAFDNQLAPPSGLQNWIRDASATEGQASTVSGCGSAPTSSGTIPTFSRTPCGKECMTCGPDSTRPSPTPFEVQDPWKRQALNKRDLPKPDDFDGDMSGFMKALCYGTGHSVRHAAQDDAFFTSFDSWTLDAVAGTFCVESLWGCTAIVAVSRKRVWMAHIYENPSISAGPDTEVWKTDIEDPIEHGGARSNIPPEQSLGTLAQLGGDFDGSNADNNVQVFVMAPTVELQGENVPSMMSNPSTHDAIDRLLMRILHVDLSRITIVPYQRLGVESGVMTFQQLRDSPYGKIAVAYDPFGSLGPIPGGASCLRPTMEVWVEAGHDAKYLDSWAPFANQTGTMPEKRFTWNGTELLHRDIPACTVASTSVPSTLTTTTSQSGSSSKSKASSRSGSHTSSVSSSVSNSSSSSRVSISASQTRSTAAFTSSAHLPSSSSASSSESTTASTQSESPSSNASKSGIISHSESGSSSSPSASSSSSSSESGRATSSGISSTSQGSGSSTTATTSMSTTMKPKSSSNGGRSTTSAKSSPSGSKSSATTALASESSISKTPSSLTSANSEASTRPHSGTKSSLSSISTHSSISSARSSSSLSPTSSSASISSPPLKTSLPSSTPTSSSKSSSPPQPSSTSSSVTSSGGSTRDMKSSIDLSSSSAPSITGSASSTTSLSSSVFATTTSSKPRPTLNPWDTPGHPLPPTSSQKKSVSLNPWDTPGHPLPPTSSQSKSVSLNPWDTPGRPMPTTVPLPWTSSSKATPISEPPLNPGHGPKTGQPTNNVPSSALDLTGTSSWVPTPLHGEAAVTG